MLSLTLACSHFLTDSLLLSPAVPRRWHTIIDEKLTRGGHKSKRPPKGAIITNRVCQIGGLDRCFHVIASAAFDTHLFHVFLITLAVTSSTVPWEIQRFGSLRDHNDAAIFLSMQSTKNWGTEGDVSTLRRKSSSSAITSSHMLLLRQQKRNENVGSLCFNKGRFGKFMFYRKVGLMLAESYPPPRFQRLRVLFQFQPIFSQQQQLYNNIDLKLRLFKSSFSMLKL